MGSGGTAMTRFLSQAKRGGVDGPPQQSLAPRGIKVLYQPSPPLTGVKPKSLHTPLPVQSSESW